MGGAGNVDLKAAAQGLRLPSPNALGPLPGPSSGFQAPREDWRSKFRSSDSFTSDRGTPVCLPCAALVSAHTSSNTLMLRYTLVLLCTEVVSMCTEVMLLCTEVVLMCVEVVLLCTEVMSLYTEVMLLCTEAMPMHHLMYCVDVTSVLDDTLQAVPSLSQSATAVGRPCTGKAETQHGHKRFIQ